MANTLASLPRIEKEKAMVNKYVNEEYEWLVLRSS